jgi:hypothetical protein
MYYKTCEICCRMLVHSERKLVSPPTLEDLKLVKRSWVN